MALPGHSPPPPFNGPGSPNRMLNGHIDNQLPPMYGPSTRPMPPPSPQNFRFPNPPPMPTPSPSLSGMNDNRNSAPYKRPGSSMSISSMLGGEPEKPVQDLYPNHNSRGPSRHGSISAIGSYPFSTMSPPQQLLKPGIGEYSYKPRSHTPDRIGTSISTSGPRQRSSSSGTPLQRSPLFVEPHTRSASTIPAPRYFEHTPNLSFGVASPNRIEQDDRARRTSLSGILQRPNSQPPAESFPSLQQDPFKQNTSSVPPLEGQPRPEPTMTNPFQTNGIGTTYDIKPPGFHNTGRPSGPQVSPTRGVSIPNSPEGRRSSTSGTQGRSLASILNGPPSHVADIAAQRMVRQDSAQSQSDRSIHGDRGKFRQYSPFASSLPPQPQNAFGIPIDEQGRKGSDESSQHRTLLGLAAESKRGRFSPMPQVMQGAQAQTPIPDAGVKTERGRVFSGLGGGISPSPVASSTRRDDGRTPLSEDNLMRMSRSGSGVNKRSRKYNEDDLAIDADVAANGRTSNGRANKKGKYQQAYKADLEDLASTGAQRKTTLLTNATPSRNTSTPLNGSLNSVNSTYQHQHQRNSEVIPIPKPKMTIKVAPVFNSVSRSSRQHLGSFTYRPNIGVSDASKSTSKQFNVSIRPNLLPSFSAAEHLNCTYTVHVPRMWLHDREKSLICAERYLWGSGIYTDDSDPVAAAIHAGFLKPSFGDAVDASLLSRVIQEQNPKIEWSKDAKPPLQPLEVVPGKDLNITLVVLPSLDRYPASARFGVKSRNWPEGIEKAQHDGVSFGVLKIEFADIGTEEMRMGRTGVGRRERLRKDLEARRRGLQIQKDKIVKTQQKRLEQLKAKAASATVNTKLAPTSVPTTVASIANVPVARQVVAVHA